MKKIKRILAFLLILSMFLGDLGQGVFMTLSAYADEDPALQSADLAPEAEAEAEAKAEAEALPKEAGEESQTQAPAEEEAAPPAETEQEAEQAEAPAPSVHKLEGVRLDAEHELSVEGYLPADDALAIVRSLYRLKEPAEGKELLWNFEFRFDDGSFTQQGSYLLTVKGETIAEMIENGTISSLRLVYDLREHREAELVEAAEDAVSFKVPRLELLALYIQRELPADEPVHETDEIASDEQELESVLPGNTTVADPDEIELPLEDDPILDSFSVDPVDQLTTDQSANLVNALGAGNKNIPFHETRTGAYASAVFDGSYRANKGAPSVNARSLGSDDYLSVLEAWSVSGLNNQTVMSVTATLNALPTLEEGESLAFYSLRSGELDAPVASDLASGESVSITLSLKSADGVALVLLAAKDAEGNPLKRYIPTDALYANDDIYLTGKMPKHGVVVVTPVETSVNGARVLAAYDISIYANQNQYAKGHKWQPAGDKVQVHLIDEALQGQSRVGVYHLADGMTEPEFVTAAAVTDGQVVFEAESFSTYIFTTLTAEIVATDGNTYRITVEYDLNAGIPMEGTELLVTEIAPDSADYAYYKSESAKAAGTDTDHIALSRSFDIKIVDAADHTRVYEPRNDVSVAITLVGSTLTDYIGVHVVHFDDGGDAKRMDASVSADTISFLTDSFSVYEVGGSVHVATFYFYTLGEYLEYEPYYLNTDAEVPVYQQIVRSGERPVAPQNPVNPQDQEATFAGWFIGGASYSTTTPQDLVNDNYTQYDFSETLTLDEDQTYYLYAKFSHFYYIIFHDQYDQNSGTFPIAFTRRFDPSQAGEGGLVL